MPISLLRKLRCLRSDNKIIEEKHDYTGSAIINDYRNPNSDCYDFFDPNSTRLHSKAFFYALALEPKEQRNERIILITEAYTVFGALFLGGMYNLWEFGLQGPNDGLGIGSDTLNAFFATIMSIGLTANLFLTLFSAFWWQQSIVWGGSNDSWAYSALDALAFCLILLFLVFTCVVLANVLAIYGNLREYLSALLVAQIFLGIVVTTGTLYNADLVAKEVPFELNKCVLWIKSIFPLTYNTKKKREVMKARGNQRREELLRRIDRETTINDIQMDNDNEIEDSSDPTKMQNSHGIRLMLKKAASNIGREKENITPFVIRLEEEWYNSCESLQGLSVATLARFMPHALAVEVHKLVSMRPRGSVSLMMRRSLDSNDINVDGNIDDQTQKRTEESGRGSQALNDYEVELYHDEYEPNFKKNLGGKTGALF